MVNRCDRTAEIVGSIPTRSTKFMTLPQLAKLAVKTYLEEGKIISPPKKLPKEFLEKKAGTFVSIHLGKKLRGCIGTYLPTRENIAKEVIQNAISAATEDIRFSPLTKEEIEMASFSVYVLDPPEYVGESFVFWNEGLEKEIKEKLDPKKYGILVKSGFKSGLLLPDLEGIDTPEKQLFFACQKAGIFPGEKISIYRFKAKKYQ